MYPILFSWGSFHLYSLPVFIILAWIIFSFIFWKLLRAEAVPEERIFDLTFYATLMALVGGRLLYILERPEIFSTSVIKMLALWVVPGLSFWGAIVAGTMTLIFLSRRSGVRLGLVLDAVALALPAALIPGALGGLLDGAEVGLPTKLPWAVHYAGFAEPRHPLGLYEIVAFSLVLTVLVQLSHRAKAKGWPYGLVGCWFFLMLTVFMFCLEFIKVSQVYFRALSLNQWLMIGIFGQTLGAFYVRGGLRGTLKPIVQKSFGSVGSGLASVYERIFKRSA